MNPFEYNSNQRQNQQSFGRSEGLQAKKSAKKAKKIGRAKLASRKQRPSQREI